MTKTLTVHNAEIHTATVEIKTLTIRGKQVTQAVFRQLKNEPLIDDDGNFRGNPWGTVNYHPNKCADADDRQHLHVVWQLGQELRRAHVEQPWYPKWIMVESAEAWLDISTVQGWRPSDAWLRDRNRPTYVVVDFGLYHVAANVRDDHERYWSYTWDEAGLNDSVRRCKAELLEVMASRCQERGLSREEAEADMLAECADEAAQRDRYRQRWAELQDLPQLFIAV